MKGGFLTGAGYLLKGLRWLPRPRLRGFVIAPLLINTLLFGGLIWWGADEFGLLLDALLAQLPTGLDWLRWLIWPLFAVAALVVSFYTFTLVATLIASPFNGLLAERVEDLANPQAARPPARLLWQEMLLALPAELRKLGYFLLRGLPLLLLFFIPGVNTAAPLLWMAFSAWMLALQFADYPMANHAIPFREQRRLLGRCRRLALGFGGAVLLMAMIPVVNFLVVPAAVIGATLIWVEQIEPCRWSHATTP
jgi:CysZ protein